MHGSWFHSALVHAMASVQTLQTETRCMITATEDWDSPVSLDFWRVAGHLG